MIGEINRREKRKWSFRRGFCDFTAEVQRAQRLRREFCSKDSTSGLSALCGKKMAYPVPLQSPRETLCVTSPYSFLCGEQPGIRFNKSPCQQAIFFYLCASFFFYGPVAQLNRATAFNFGALNGKQNHLSGYHRIGEPFPACPVGNTEETLEHFCIFRNDLSSYEEQR